MKKIEENIQEILEEFEKFLEVNLPSAPSFHPHFDKALKEMLKAGGKRFRPLLLLSVVKSQNKSLFKNALYPALAIELLHTYSLIHDDLPAMDNADFRRSHPTLHKSYDEVTAILVGDALNTHAFNVLAQTPLQSELVVQMIQTLSSLGGINGMILGQAIDCEFEQKTLSLEQLEFLHIHKTAKLIKAALKMGAIISQMDKKSTKNLEIFGEKIGLLFQIQDDIIDSTLSDEKAGKPTHNDEYKNSFTNLLGLKKALEKKDELIKEVLNLLANFDDNLRLNLDYIVKKYLK